MNYYNVNDLKKVFFEYFVDKCGHAKIPGASLVPTVDESVLFTPAGMHPLIPYLTGSIKHPKGDKLVNIQNVIRTGAINQVGSDFYLTFFELFGVWMMNDYDKYDVLLKVWNFLTSKEYLGIGKEQIYITYFAGNESHPLDIDTLHTWQKIGLPLNHTFQTSKNWKGPYSHEHICGPNTRIFYDTKKAPCSKECNALCSCGKYVELWDVVFFDYLMKDNQLTKANHPFVDMGAGVERIASLVQNVKTIYDTDRLNEIVNTVTLQIKKSDDIDDLDILRKCRIIADHLRCTCFTLGDEVITAPSNKGRGYVLRKIIRRAINIGEELGFDTNSYKSVIDKIIELYKDEYPLLETRYDFINEALSHEYEIYKTTLKKNLLQIEKIIKSRESVSDEDIKKLFDTYGVPINIIKGVVQKQRILEKE